MDTGDMTEEREGLQRLLEKVYCERGFDFREYRETTLTRRLGRRLRACGAETYAQYAGVLDQDPAEYDRLFNDLTINITGFFRDDVAFQALEEVALPALTGKEAKSILIWSAGCATGEEAYSIAMLLLETLGQEVGLWNVTILGTDIDAKALDHARDGWFALRDVKCIRQAWLDKYFVLQNGGYCVQPALKQSVTFETHNLISDSPYHDLDLVVCRNVLIYFTPALQSRVLRNLYEGLKDGGFLLLGKAELPLGETKVLFDCVDSKAKLFRRVGQSSTDCSLSIGHKPVRNKPPPDDESIQNGKSAVKKVVVIAASAGGIDSLTQVLSRLPPDLPAAVLVVQHLLSDRETHLPEYLAHHSPLKVQLAQGGMPLEAGVIYVAMPGKHLRVGCDGLSTDLGAPVHYVRPSGDVLFASAAQAFGPNVIGVVLSGTGCDAAHGCWEIKANGGVTIAQDENTSPHFAMPKAAIDAKAVDYVLPLRDIAGKIVALTHEIENTEREMTL